jgi:4-alpha-glucanotransferase
LKNELEEFLLNTEAHEQWKRVGVKHHHGICVPLFSLYSEKSSGIGEFLDLLPLITWCKELGLDVLQLLPLNDIGLGTSPYSAISAFALNPLHLSLHALKDIEKVENYETKLTKVRYWNKTLRVKYHIVREIKYSILKSYYEVLFPSVSCSEAYLKFIDENHWLKPYSLFRTIKELQFWQDWEKWPEELKHPKAPILHKIYDQYKSECDFSMFLQFLCYEQMKEVRDHAQKKGVFLKGDLPILISRDSTDVWSHPELFQLQYSAGAPSDIYSKEGQNWGFPIYDWDNLAKTDYAWWKDRLKIVGTLYHLYRIDHVVGFYRIWAIPTGKSASEGQFLPPTEKEQKQLGEALMKMMIHSTSALPIGEDLGLVPTWVKSSLHALGICTTKMMRWERKWEDDGFFINPSKYTPVSMSTLSTHDSDTLILWWRHFPKEAKLFCEYKGWTYEPFLSKERLKEIIYESHHSNSLFHINLLFEYLSAFPDLVSGNPSNERINIPGKILDRNWSYRIPVSVETLVTHEGLKDLFQDILRHRP